MIRRVKVVLPGGSGQVGALLARTFAGDGHEVVVLSRGAEPGPGRFVPWDARTLGPWAAELDGADVVVNLAGRSVNCRYTDENRRQILDSRVASTRVVGEAIARAARPPRVWLQASTATIYAHRYDAPNDEATGIIGGQEPDAPKSWGFSIEVAKAWERTLDEAPTPATRKVKLRATLILGPERGGIFDTLLGLVRRGLGGTAGSGRQYMSWMHDADFARAVQWLIEHEEIDGVVNVGAPHPLPNAEFMRVLREAWGTRIGLPATEWMLALGALAMGSETELALKSRRVVPARLLDSGFSFLFPHWPDAARDLCQRWRAAASR
jgi:uncharacterized protein (TIGR01777 family)